MRMDVLGVVALGLLTAACGSSGDQRAATGGLSGVGVGALVGGPVGAVVGGAVGAAGGTAMPEGADTIATNALNKERDVGTSAVAEAALAPVDGSGPVRRAQSELKREGLYEGGVDGIAGPATTRGITEFQQREGLPQTARLDRATRDRMTVNALRMDSVSSARARGKAATEGSDNSMAPSADSRPTDANQPAGGSGISRDP